MPSNPPPPSHPGRAARRRLAASQSARGAEGFVERMTAINKGRAFFTRPGQLGSYLMVDYLSRRRKRWK